MECNILNKDKLLRDIFRFCLSSLKLHLNISDIIAYHNGTVYIIYHNNLNWFDYDKVKFDNTYPILFKDNCGMKNYIFNGDSSLIGSEFSGYNMRNFPIDIIICHTNINEAYSNIGVLFYVSSINKSCVYNIHPDKFDTVFIADYTNANFKLIDGI